MTTDLSALTTAAEQWDGMAAKFHKQELAYKRDVHGISLGPTWQGLSAEAASKRFDVTLKEFQRAQVEAKAIASLLRDAHTQVTSLRGKLESARKDAVEAGMKVSDKGVVSFDTEKLSQAEHTAYVHDPDYQDSVRKSVTSWQQLIDQRVKDVGDADKDIQTALQSVVIDDNVEDGTFAGFNGQAKGDIDAYGHEKPAATKPDGYEGEFKVTGPDVGFTVTGDPKYGKEGSVKAYADLFHVTAKGSHTDGKWKLSGVGDLYGGARATANYGFSDKGFTAKAEGSVGVRDLGEVRLDYGDRGGVYGRTEGFAGAEAGVNAKLTKEEATVGAKAFYGAKQSIAGGVEVAGIGIGGSAEGGVGEGVDAWVGWKNKNGVWKFGAKGFGAAAVGAGAGVEITVDTHKFGKAVDGAADAVGDFAGSVKNTVGGWF
ncbi:hypothetical protein [Streptomyces sp. NPDC051636]|uniref:hypothetical protein n=1 Tax=Streptomyces sp. NPDC051636 TaxID=3365663 RepID=UPI0037935BAB